MRRLAGSARSKLKNYFGRAAEVSFDGPAPCRLCGFGALQRAAEAFVVGSCCSDSFLSFVYSGVTVAGRATDVLMRRVPQRLMTCTWVG